MLTHAKSRTSGLSEGESIRCSHCSGDKTQDVGAHTECAVATDQQIVHQKPLSIQIMVRNRRKEKEVFKASEHGAIPTHRWIPCVSCPAAPGEQSGHSPEFRECSCARPCVRVYVCVHVCVCKLSCVRLGEYQQVGLQVRPYQIFRPLLRRLLLNSKYFISGTSAMRVVASGPGGRLPRG